MNALILVSHGNLAQGMKNAAAMFIGSAENIYALSMCRDEEAARLISNILGGSDNNKMTTLA